MTPVHYFPCAMLQSPSPTSSDLLILVIAGVVVGHRVLRHTCGLRFPRLRCRIVDHSIFIIIIITIVAVSDQLKGFKFGRFAVRVFPVGLEGWQSVLNPNSTPEIYGCAYPTRLHALALLDTLGHLILQLINHHFCFFHALLLPLALGP